MHVSLFTTRFLRGGTNAVARGSTRHHRASRPIYVSLTTIPTRVGQLERHLAQMQDWPIDGILLAVPRGLAVPRHPKLTVIEVERDLGPITKLVPAVEYLREKSPEALILVLDDDQGYPPGMVAELVYAWERTGGVMAGSGQRFYLYGMKPARVPKVAGHHFGVGGGVTVAEVDLVEGYGGILAAVSTFDTATLRRYAELSVECRRSDDVVISATLALAGVPRYRICRSPHFHVGRILPRPHGLGADALFRGNSIFDNRHAANYRRALQRIESCE